MSAGQSTCVIDRHKAEQHCPMSNNPSNLCSNEAEPFNYEVELAGARRASVSSLVFLNGFMSISLTRLEQLDFMKLCGCSKRFMINWPEMPSSIVQDMSVYVLPYSVCHMAIVTPFTCPELSP